MKKYSIYVDLGYRDATTLTIVDQSEERHKAFFRSIGPNSELDDTIRYIIESMDQFNVTSESLYIPHFPAIEAEIGRCRPTRKYLDPRR
jgi:hypothetical protein